MVSVIATIVLLLALASITLGQDFNNIVDCLDGVATPAAAATCTDACMETMEKHRNRLFIIKENYGYKCMADGEATSGGATPFKLRLTTCFATINDTHYQAFSDAALNNLRSLAENKGPDDAEEVWKICKHLIDTQSEWKAYQKVKAKEGSFASFYSADIRSVYYVTSETESGTKTLKFQDILSAVKYNLAQIPNPIELFHVANTCSGDVGNTLTYIADASHFVDGTAVYTCKDVLDGVKPALLGCLTVMPAVPAAQSATTIDLTYITIATVKQLKQVYFGTGFASATNRPLDDIAKMSVKKLCDGISDEYMNNKNLFDQPSKYAPKPTDPVTDTAVLAWFAPTFYVSDDPAV